MSGCPDASRMGLIHGTNRIVPTRYAATVGSAMPSTMQPAMPMSRARKRLEVPSALIRLDRLVARDVWPVTTLMIMPQAAVGMAMLAACFAPSMQQFPRALISMKSSLLTK